MQRRVIAVAAPMGGGKSTLVDALAAALGSDAGPAPTLRFDDYEHATRQSVDQLAQWLAGGADFDRLEAPGLAADLAAWRSGGTASCATDLVFEMPLGRAWTATAAHIDLLVWVDVPLDIALARRLRDIGGGLLQQGPDADLRQGLSWLHDYLGHYLQTLHAVLAVQRRVVRADADVLVDGQAVPEAMVRQALDALGLRR